MTKYTSFNPLEKIVGGIKNIVKGLGKKALPYVAALTFAAGGSALYSNNDVYAQPKKFDKNTTFTKTGANGESYELQLVHLHGRDFLVDPLPEEERDNSKLPFILYDANLVNVINSKKTKDGKINTEIEPLVGYESEKIKYEGEDKVNGLVDVIKLQKEGAFGKIGNTMRKELNDKLKQEAKNKAGYTKDIKGADFTGDYETAVILGEEYFFPYFAKADSAAEGEVLKMVFMPTEGYEEVINYSEQVFLRNADKVFQWAYSEDKSEIKKETSEFEEVKKAAQVNNYPPASFPSPITTGEKSSFGEHVPKDKPNCGGEGQKPCDKEKSGNLELKVGLNAGKYAGKGGFFESSVGVPIMKNEKGKLSVIGYFRYNDKASKTVSEGNLNTGSPTPISLSTGTLVQRDETTTYSNKVTLGNEGGIGLDYETGILNASLKLGVVKEKLEENVTVEATETKTRPNNDVKVINVKTEEQHFDEALSPTINLEAYVKPIKIFAPESRFVDVVEVGAGLKTVLSNVEPPYNLEDSPFTNESIKGKNAYAIPYAGVKVNLLKLGKSIFNKQKK